LKINTSTADRWETEFLYINNSHFYSAVIEKIANAKRTIDLEMYIFQLDAMGLSIVEHLRAAASRGVKVRVLVDAVGSATNLGELETKLTTLSLEFRVYHSFFWGKFLHFFSVANRRNHRKMWIFDSDRVFISSANIIANDWKEIGLSVSGLEVSQLQTAYENAWQPRKWPRRPNLRRLFIPPNRTTDSLVRLNETLVQKFRNQRDFLSRIRNAHDRVWLTNAYFVPRYSLIRALTTAASKGRDVRLLLPQKSDVFFMSWVASTYYYGLLKGGVKIYEYLPSMYHAKTRIIDSWMLVGTSNLNRRSLLHDLEVDLILTHPENRKALVDDAITGFEDSRRIDLSEIKKISIFQKSVAHLLLIFRYWL